MNNILFKSTGADLSKILSILDTLQKNVLYLTYQTDKILKIARSSEVNKDLQTQVDKYFEDDETSPQTDQAQD